MGAAKGQFDNDDSDELFFSVVNQCPYASEVVRSLCNYIIEVSGDLQTITVGPLRLDVSTLSNPWIYTPFSVAAGDLNDDGRDEAIVTAWNDVLHIYEVK